jgi:hypothetical protein
MGCSLPLNPRNHFYERHQIISPDLASQIDGKHQQNEFSPARISSLKTIKNRSIRVEKHLSLCPGRDCFSLTHWRLFIMAQRYKGQYVSQSNDLVALRVIDPEIGITVNMWNRSFHEDFPKNCDLALELAAKIVPQLPSDSGFHNITVGDNDVQAALIRIGSSLKELVGST